ncbi:MAG: FAD-binding protein [Gemmatimonadetes bacterium]|nr:FAD-binding protein [Gemmatimonadota bacterium]
MDLAIIGGGLAGLVAAFELAGAGRRVALYEAQAQAGGQVRTRHQNGYLIEEGAEGFVAADVAVPALCKELGLADQIIPQLERRSLLLRGGSLSDLSTRDGAALLGIPVPDESRPGGLSSLKAGMGALPHALLNTLKGKVEIFSDCPVTRIDRANGQWRLTTSGGATREAPNVLLAVPPRAAAALIAPIDPEAAALLETLVLTSNLCVSLGYPRTAVSHPLAATGFVVAPGNEGSEGLRACGFSSSKFANRAPRGTVLLRAFFRPEPDELHVSDEGWVDRSVRVLGAVLGLSGTPAEALVSRWPEAIPQYGPGHQGLVGELLGRLERLGSLHLAGAAYVPGGVPGAVRSGRDVARSVARPLPV